MEAKGSFLRRDSSGSGHTGTRPRGNRRSGLEKITHSHTFKRSTRVRRKIKRTREVSVLTLPLALSFTATIRRLDCFVAHFLSWYLIRTRFGTARGFIRSPDIDDRPISYCPVRSVLYAWVRSFTTRECEIARGLCLRVKSALRYRTIHTCDLFAR